MYNTEISILKATFKLPVQFNTTFCQLFWGLSCEQPEAKGKTVMLVEYESQELGLDPASVTNCSFCSNFLESFHIHLLMGSKIYVNGFHIKYMDIC